MCPTSLSTLSGVPDSRWNMDEGFDPLEVVRIAVAMSLSNSGVNATNLSFKSTDSCYLLLDRGEFGLLWLGFKFFRDIYSPNDVHRGYDVDRFPIWFVPFKALYTS